jgi:hypothetical protein
VPVTGERAFTGEGCSFAASSPGVRFYGIVAHHVLALGQEQGHRRADPEGPYRSRFIPVRVVTQPAQPGKELPQFPIYQRPVGVEGAIQKLRPDRIPTIRFHHRPVELRRLVAMEV